MISSYGLVTGEVAGHDPLANHPDVYSPPIFGPAIKFAGQLQQWTGDATSFSNEVAVDARISFESYAGGRSTSILEIDNVGTTALYFDWKVSQIIVCIICTLLNAGPNILVNQKKPHESHGKYWLNAGSLNHTERIG